VCFLVISVTFILFYYLVKFDKLEKGGSVLKFILLDLFLTMALPLQKSSVRVNQASTMNHTSLSEDENTSQFSLEIASPYHHSKYQLLHPHHQKHSKYPEHPHHQKHSKYPEHPHHQKHSKYPEHTPATYTQISHFKPHHAQHSGHVPDYPVIQKQKTTKPVLPKRHMNPNTGLGKKLQSPLRPDIQMTSNLLPISKSDTLMDIKTLSSEISGRENLKNMAHVSEEYIRKLTPQMIALAINKAHEEIEADGQSSVNTNELKYEMFENFFHEIVIKANKDGTNHIANFLATPSNGNTTAHFLAEIEHISKKANGKDNAFSKQELVDTNKKFYKMLHKIMEHRENGSHITPNNISKMEPETKQNVWFNSLKSFGRGIFDRSKELFHTVKNEAVALFEHHKNNPNVISDFKDKNKKNSMKWAKTFGHTHRHQIHTFLRNLEHNVANDLKKAKETIEPKMEQWWQKTVEGTERLEKFLKRIKTYTLTKAKQELTELYKDTEYIFGRMKVHLKSLEEKAAKEVKKIEKEAMVIGKEIEEKTKDVAKVVKKELKKAEEEVKKEVKEVKNIVGNKESMRKNKFDQLVDKRLEEYKKMFG